VHLLPYDFPLYTSGKTHSFLPLSFVTHTSAVGSAVSIAKVGAAVGSRVMMGAAAEYPEYPEPECPDAGAKVE